MSIVSAPVIGALKAYRLVVSPLYGQTCRYYPSCSAYALGSVERFGAARGGWLAVRRLARCHPWCAGGVDLVPEPGHYRWWGRADGTDGEDDAGEYVPVAPTARIGRDTGEQSHHPLGA